MNAHTVMTALIALAGTIAGYYFRSMSQSIRALECALQECLSKVSETPPPLD